MMLTPRFPLRRLLPLALAAGMGLPASSAFAVNKDMIQLQTQVQELQEAIARLQQSNDERAGVLKDLVQQSADSVNKMSTAVDSIQRQLQTEREANSGKVDQVSGQVGALNDSLDEIKARLGRLEKLIQDVQGQQQSMSANLQGAPAGSATAPPAGVSAGTPTASLATAPAAADSAAAGGDAIPLRGAKPSAAIPLNDAAAGADTSSAPATSTGPAPPVDQLYRAALGDYMAAKYGLSQSEFADVTKSYPTNPLAGNAYYYQGEIDYRGGRYGAAVKNYDRVIEQFPDSNKVPASHLHKGQALIQLKQNEAGTRELRALIQRFPNSPEATQARSRLNGMGVTVKPRG